MAESKYTSIDAMQRDIVVLDKFGIAWEAYSAVEPADGLADEYAVIVVKAIEVTR